MDMELLLEAERRGILPPDKQALLAEARKRGLVPTASDPQQQAAPKPAAPQTGLREQGMSGLNEGLARLAGTPVDLATAGLNAGAAGINRLAGTNIPPIENPVGGSQTFEGLLSKAGAISENQPQTGGQRYARRIGQELGYGAPITMATMGAAGPAMASRAAYAGTGTAADVMAGAAGQTAREIAPDSDMADFAATLIGGTGTAAGIAAASRSRPPAPTRDQLQQQTEQLYGRVKNSGTNLTPEAQQEFLQRMQQRMSAEGGNPLSHPKATGQIGKIEANPRTSVYEIEQARRRMGQHVARTPDESAMGGALRDEIDSYLKGLDQTQVTGGNAVDTVDTLQKARHSAHQGIKYDEVMDAMDRGDSRAATTGSGGNTLNTQSQNVRRIYDKEVSRRNGQKSGGYTPDEVSAMEKVVFPGRAERGLRLAGKLSPTGNGLSAMLGVGGLAGGLGAGNQALTSAVVAGGMGGFMAKNVAEQIKKKRIQEIADVILRGGTAQKKTANQGAKAAIAAQLASPGLVPQ